MGRQRDWGLSDQRLIKSPQSQMLTDPETLPLIPPLATAVQVVHASTIAVAPTSTATESIRDSTPRTQKQQVKGGVRVPGNPTDTPTQCFQDADHLQGVYGALELTITIFP